MARPRPVTGFNTGTNRLNARASASRPTLPAGFRLRCRFGVPGSFLLLQFQLALAQRAPKDRRVSRVVALNFFRTCRATWATAIHRRIAPHVRGRPVRVCKRGDDNSTTRSWHPSMCARYRAEAYKDRHRHPRPRRPALAVSVCCAAPPAGAALIPRLMASQDTPLDRFRWRIVKPEIAHFDFGCCFALCIDAMPPSIFTSLKGRRPTLFRARIVRGVAPGQALQRRIIQWPKM
ncbi:hypothetical protein DFP91_3391 [Pseudorhodoplanes sinuspersici]|nr:hypothetical protein DFP91_3391 [Pseudorhodoplanes sinuspersici]